MLVPDEMQNLFTSVLKTHTGSSERLGAVKQVQDDCIKVICGIRPDGSPLISPWLRPGTQSGVNREKHTFEVGQNVNLSSIAGSFRNALVNHWAPNNSHPSPPQSQAGERAERHRRQVWLELSQVQPQRRLRRACRLQRGRAQPAVPAAERRIRKRRRWWRRRPAGRPAAGPGAGSGNEVARCTRRTASPTVSARTCACLPSKRKQSSPTARVCENTVFCNQEGCFSTKPIQIKKPTVPTPTTTKRCSEPSVAPRPTPGSAGPRRPPPPPPMTGAASTHNKELLHASLSAGGASPSPKSRPSPRRAVRPTSSLTSIIARTRTDWAV